MVATPADSATCFWKIGVLLPGFATATVYDPGASERYGVASLYATFSATVR